MVQGSGFRVQGSGFRVQGLTITLNLEPVNGCPINLNCYFSFFAVSEKA
jgi:hypothetical protein